jgi:hypothetical protein
MQVVSSFSEPGSAYATELTVILTFGVWFNYAYESVIFFLNLGFNKLFRSELKVLFRIGDRSHESVSAIGGPNIISRIMRTERAGNVSKTGVGNR